MSDVSAFAQYYITVTLLGIALLPLTKKLLPLFPDKGWVFSKILGTLAASYLIWLGGMNQALAFTRINSVLVVVFIAVIVWTLWYLDENPDLSYVKSITTRKKLLGLIALEELLFLLLFAGWTAIRGFNPNIHGLEKFMDYGFMLSILRAEYFPPIDHFFASEPINYYYFGHHIAAVLTRLSQVPANLAYNLQIALVFALTFMGSFSIGVTLISKLMKKHPLTLGIVLSGTLSGVLTAVTGNLHAILNVRDLDSYWYATATRLIPFTINEFPVYSFVVADLHAHMSNIPQTLLALAVIVHIPSHIKTMLNGVKEYVLPLTLLQYIILAAIIGSFYPTNAWDFPIYLILTGLTTIIFYFKNLDNKYKQEPLKVLKRTITLTAIGVLPLFVISILSFLPFWVTVKPISDGIGIVKDLSPLKEFLTLWGMYLFLAASFILFTFRATITTTIQKFFSPENAVATVANLLGVDATIPSKKGTTPHVFKTDLDIFALILIGMWVMLLIVPELIFVEDIYKPDYYRANTMFKLYYAGWIFVSIASAYSFSRMVIDVRSKKSKFWATNVALQYLLIVVTLLYPYMAIKTTTNTFKEYFGIDGTAYLESLHPHDAEAIDWINQNISGQPVILEAVGESYTDYARIASNTGIPTVMGWPVHEWLWRGSYGEPIQPPSKVLEETGTDTVAQRVSEVQQIYTTDDKDKATTLLDKYQVAYIYIGDLEREKYPELNQQLLLDFGTIVYQNQGSIIVKR